eukprot:GGOE01062487.1.p1 GENE.GGOE01062487.1~~GGOE01062487.1.p1  ORF type:complete len:493 (-),score=98.72 GGOE01062487.1:537-2015(-)
MASTQRAGKTAFSLQGPDGDQERFTLKVHIDPGDRLPSQRRPVECITCRLSCCNLPTAPALGSPASPNWESPKKKKAAKESDLVKVSHSTRFLPAMAVRTPSQTNPTQAGTAPCMFIAVNFYDFILFYDLHRYTEEATNACEFFQQPLCHDLNASSAGPERVDLCIGFISGDIAVWDPLQRRMLHRYNREKLVDPTAVTCVRWLPLDGQTLAVGHESGVLYVYDKRLSEEAGFPRETLEPFVVQPNAKAKCNPTHRWAISNRTLNDIVFSPTQRYCAIPSRDSYCHVIHWEDRRLKLRVQSFFGAMLCACWSPDERFLVMGGEDDTVSVLDFANECIVGRCVGHRSWVTCVAFDTWRLDSQADPQKAQASDNRSEPTGLDRYRFISVSQDSRLLCWEFEPLVVDEDPTPMVSLDRVLGSPITGTGSGGEQFATCHSGVVVRTVGKHIPVLDPIGMHRLHHEPVIGLHACKEGIVTVFASSVIKLWQITLEEP